METKRISILFICLLSFVLLFVSPVYSSGVFAETETSSTYTVKSGDSLCAIARDVLGDASRWWEVYELNRATISNPRLIFQGQVINLPETSFSQTEEERSIELAKEYIALARDEEPMLTSLLKEIKSDKAYLEGLENRIKSEESLARKIRTDAQEKEISLEEAASEIANIVRYTLCIQDEEYVSIVDEMLNKLTGTGCMVVIFKNTWGGTRYKGINTKIKTPGGYLFEIQFHTPSSFEAKTVEHEYYEIIRNPQTSDEERTKLEKLSSDIYKQVPIPEGAA